MAGSHSDLTLDESPVAISSFTSQIELGCIGRTAPLCCVFLFYRRVNVFAFDGKNAGT